jgi:RNA polymerase sigma-70 factor (ECF subfamily)
VSAIRLPPYVYGRGGSFFVPMLMQMAAKAGESVYVDDGRLRTSDVHVDDAAALFLLAAREAKAGDVFNGTGSTTVTLRELAEAIGAALKLPARSVSREEAEARWGQFLTAFVQFENRPSNRKAVQQLGWQPKGIDMLTDIRSGSYRKLAYRKSEVSHCAWPTVFSATDKLRMGGFLADLALSAHREQIRPECAAQWSKSGPYPKHDGPRNNSMHDPMSADAGGPFEARYLAFLETITHLRPSLHRYCSRMTGSVLDGEDVVQDALFQAYRKLDTFEDDRPLAPWLFRIAHNRCVDFLRRREVRQEAEAAVMEPDSVVPADPVGPILDRAVEHLVLALPPKERASVLLKDVFDYSLEEIAELVDSSVGGVKAALNRGRSKLASLPQPSTPPPRAADPEMSRLLHLYVERFNQRDWDGLRELITADARLLVADRFAGPLVNAPYFDRYERSTIPWQMAVGEVDGQPAVIAMRQDDGEWIPHAIVRVEVTDHLIMRVADYSHCPWVLRATASVIVEPS